MIRLFITAIIFYLIFRFLKGLAYISAATQRQQTSQAQPTEKPKQNVYTKIDNKDIVEAEFVEIKNREE